MYTVTVGSLEGSYTMVVSARNARAALDTARYSLSLTAPDHTVAFVTELKG